MECRPYGSEGTYGRYCPQRGFRRYLWYPIQYPRQSLLIDRLLTGNAFTEGTYGISTVPLGHFRDGGGR